MQERERHVRRRLLVALCVLALSSSISMAPASDPGSCPTNDPSYVGSRTCALGFTGFPIVFFGNAEVTSGQASVRVWVAPRGYPLVVLGECSASAARFTQCDGGLPDQTTAAPLPPQLHLLALECHVEGTAHGTFGCKTGP